MNKINELQKHHLNCNVFSVYDYDGMNMQELLSTFFTKIQECVKNSNEMSDLAQWLVNEGLSQEVAVTLVKWLEDGTLKDIINDEIFTELHSSVNKIDLNQNPIIYTGVNGKETSVMQDFHILKNGNILMSQVSPQNHEDESFSITQCTPNGQIINAMTILGGGHGNFTVCQAPHGNIDVLFCNPKNELCQMPYMAGTWDVSAATVLYKSTSEKVYPKVNNDEGLLSLTRKNNLGQWYCTDVFDVEKYLSGESYIPLHHIEHEEIGVMQGASVDAKNLYLLYGYVNAVIQIVEIDLKTGERKQYDYPHVINNSPNQNATTEAEGMCVSKNQLYIGIALGEPSVLRENLIYVFSPVNKMMDNLNYILNNVQMFKLTEPSGTCKSFKHNNKLSNITEPGEYYFTATQFAEMEDVPQYTIDVGSGYFLNVSARAKDGNVVQTLTRNTSGNNRFVIQRSVSIEGVASDWKALGVERGVLHYGDTRTVTEIQLTDSIKNYDMLVINAWAPNGKATTHTLFPTQAPITDGKIVFSGVNLGDSGTSTSLYAWELHVEISEDGRTLTQSKKNQLQLSNGGVNTATQNVDMGVFSVIGIRGLKNV